MPRLADRLAAVERRLLPPPPTPGSPTIYCEATEVMATAERPVAEGVKVAAVLPRVLPVAEWEQYAVAQQADSVAHARERIRALDVDTMPVNNLLPDNVVPMTR